MSKANECIIGCGDVGLRIARHILADADKDRSLALFSRSRARVEGLQTLGLQVEELDLDDLEFLPVQLNRAQIYYLVPPPREGQQDLRSRTLLNAMQLADCRPARVVLISTTGVYGDQQGAWVDEGSPTRPATDRGKRRLDSEQQWSAFCNARDVPCTILRVPGIYSYSRLPRQRLEAATPVVRADECGFTNRIHADDLARIAVLAMRAPAKPLQPQIYNVTDGTPGKISEYLQAAAEVLGLPPLPEISMAQAHGRLSEGMLSYLSESRKISNRKMLDELKVALLYADFRTGLRH